MATAAWKACWRMQPQQGRQHPWSRTNRPEAGVGRSWSLPMQKQYISQMSLHRCIRKCQKLSEVGDLRTAMSPRHFWVVSQIISWWFQGVVFFSPQRFQERWCYLAEVYTTRLQSQIHVQQCWEELQLHDCWSLLPQGLQMQPTGEKEGFYSLLTENSFWLSVIFKYNIPVFPSQFYYIAQKVITHLLPETHQYIKTWASSSARKTFPALPLIGYILKIHTLRLKWMIKANSHWP